MKPEQGKLKIKVKRDKVGKAAVSFLKARTELANAKEDMERSSAKLVEEMRKAKRQSINVKGVIVTLRHIEAQDQLKVKKPKE